VEFSASVFNTQYSNFIEYVDAAGRSGQLPDHHPGLYRPENIGKAKIYGAEFNAALHAGPVAAKHEGLQRQPGGALERHLGKHCTGKKADLPSVQPYKANATFAYDSDVAGAAFTASTARGKRAASDVLTGSTTTMFDVPGYTVFDLTAYWHINKHVVLSGGVYNLGDKKYWDYASSRSLPAATTAATLADIERQSRPGRNYAFNLKVIY
jgi:hemoglobin/transferrin/lactoferrin receptor protein